jgi:hypothetical protein
MSITGWHWECFERFIHSETFEVADAGPLLSPISSFKITRDRKHRLILESLVLGEPQTYGIPAHPDGTVRLTTERVEFSGNGGGKCTAEGVLPCGKNETHNADLEKETTQRSRVHSLTATLKNEVEPAYTIDWIGNLQQGEYVWQGSTIEELLGAVHTLKLGRGAKAIELSLPGSGSGFSFPNLNFAVLEMVIAGVRLFLCRQVQGAPKQIDRPGYIFYVGAPTDEVRTKIRQVLAFCLGNYFVYFGSTMLSENSEIVSFSAISPPSIGQVSEMLVLPPAVLWTGAFKIADQNVVARMANAIYAHYDELRFNHLSWVYWHARCAPVHMAAVHFGAAIEALQEAYMEANSAKFPRALIADKAKWKILREAFLAAIEGAELDPAVSRILTNKVQSNLNQTPPSVLSERILAAIGITLGKIETAAWMRRNDAAHGEEVDIENAVPTIKDTKLLRIILHRMILKITGASGHYYDDYTVGHPSRSVVVPVPSPPLEVGQ